jgi:hypothetical protein
MSDKELLQKYAELRKIVFETLAKPILETLRSTK